MWRNLTELAMACVIVTLTIANFHLRRDLTDLTRSQNPNATSSFEAGQILPAFRARDGANRLIPFASAESRERILIFVLPGCDSCEKVLEDVQRKPSPSVDVVSVLPAAASRNEARKIVAPVRFFSLDSVRHSPLRDWTRSVPQILRIEPDRKVVEVCHSYETCLAHLAS
jgi:hypothetical protein